MHTATNSLQDGILAHFFHKITVLIDQILYNFEPLLYFLSPGRHDAEQEETFFARKLKDCGELEMIF